MRCLKSVSIALAVLALSGCARQPYRKLTRQEVFSPAAREILRAPVYTRELYRCVVDGGFLFKKYHISGVLLFKRFEDKSERVVFQNELGVSFFNFKWDANDSFSVTSVMPQLNKQAVLRILQTDFELLLRKNLDTSGIQQLKSGTGDIIAVGKNAGNAWYEVSGRSIVYGGKSPVTTISIDSTVAPTRGLPKKLSIRHHKARFTIDLNSIPADEQ